MAHCKSIFELYHMVNAVGIGVSKGKSTVAVLRPAGEVVRINLERACVYVSGIPDDSLHVWCRLCLWPSAHGRDRRHSRFNHRSAITAFAGVDPGVNQSWTMNYESNRASKHGAP